MVLKINHNELRELLKEYYKKKLSLFVIGGFGIGKSFVIRDTAREIAENRAREFIEWNKISQKKKQEVYEYPEKYFVFIDERLAEEEPTDIKGLPSFKENTDVLNWRMPFWCKLLTQENSDGFLFFDEINLAPPLVQSAVYKIIYDRVIGEEKIGNNWLVLGAGNRDEDRAFTHTIPYPLRDRGGEVELITPSVENWTEWAIPQGIDSRIIGFVNFKPSCLYAINFDDNQKQTTTRGWERLNTLIKERKIDDTFKLLCCSAIGEGIAREFIAFCELQDKFNIEEIIKNPKKLKEIDDISIKYLLLSSVAERYAKKEKGIDFEKIMEISEVLDACGNAEFVALLWKLGCVYTKDSGLFKNDFMKYPKLDLISKYGKYIK